MQNIESNLADASFQLRVSRKTLATLAKFFSKRGYTLTSKSELGRMSLEALKHIVVANFGVREFTDSVEATNFLQSLGLAPLSVRGREKAYMRTLQKEVALEGGVLAFDPFERPETVGRPKMDDLSQVEQERIDRLTTQFEEEDAISRSGQTEDEGNPGRDTEESG